MAAKKCCRSVPVAISASTRGFPSQHVPHRLDQFRLAHNFHERASRFQGKLQAENFCKSLVGEEQPLGGVHDRYAFHHASQNGGREIALCRERANGLIEPRGGAIHGGAECFESIAGTVRWYRPKIAGRDTP